MKRRIAVSKTMHVEIAIASFPLKWNRPIVMGTTTEPPPTPATLAIPRSRGRITVAGISSVIIGKTGLWVQIVYESTTWHVSQG